MLGVERDEIYIAAVVALSAGIDLAIIDPVQERHRPAAGETTTLRSPKLAWLDDEGRHVENAVIIIKLGGKAVCQLIERTDVALGNVRAARKRATHDRTAQRTSI